MLFKIDIFYISKMAKINNLQVYPFTNDLDVRDYVIGTDWNDMKRTKNFPVKNIGLALGMAGVRVEEVYLGFAPISVNDVPLSEQVQAMLNVHSLEVDFNTLIILKVLYQKRILGNNNEETVYTNQINYYFPKGQGTHDPISSSCSFEDLIVDYEKSVSINEENIISSPDAEVIQLGDLSSVVDFDLVEYLNTNGNLYAIDNEEKVYYIRYTIDDTSYLYFFNVASSENGYGIYGLGNSQFNQDELKLLFDSSNTTSNNSGEFMHKQAYISVINEKADLDNYRLTDTLRHININQWDNVEDGVIETIQFNNDGAIYPKMLFTIHNKSNAPILIKHNASLPTVNHIKFYFPKLEDYTIEPKEILQFWFDTKNGKTLYFANTNIPLIPSPLTKHSELNLDDGTNPHGTTKGDVGLGNVRNIDIVGTAGQLPFTNATGNGILLRKILGADFNLLGNDQIALWSTAANNWFARSLTDSIDGLTIPLRRIGTGQIRANDPLLETDLVNLRTFKKVNYFTISSNTILSDIHHGGTFWVTASCTITIPVGLRTGINDFTCNIRTLTGVVVTYVTSGGAIINSESNGSIQDESSMINLATFSANNYILSGGSLSW